MPVNDEQASLSTRAWSWWMLTATALLLVAVAAFNAVVDPTAQLGSGMLEPVAAGPRDRTAKVKLLERADVMPPLVVLGSSRTKKLDPAWLRAHRDARDSDATPARGVAGINGAVVGGDLFEARVLAAQLARRAVERDEPFPQLVVGIDVEQFRDSSLHGSGFLDVPAVATIARREASGSSGSLADEAKRFNRLLLTVQVTKASLASLRARVAAPAAQAAATGEDPDEPGSVSHAFTERGTIASDARWFGPAAARLASRTPDAVRASIVEYHGTYDAVADRLDEDAVADLRAVVRIARAAGGPPPLLYVTPAHPSFVSALQARGQRARHRRVVRLLDRLAATGDAVTVDCLRCVDGAARNWIDGTHPSPIGAGVLAERLAERLASER